VLGPQDQRPNDVDRVAEGVGHGGAVVHADRRDHPAAVEGRQGGPVGRTAAVELRQPAQRLAVGLGGVPDRDRPRHLDSLHRL
jgi:hypothetical protein